MVYPQLSERGKLSVKLWECPEPLPKTKNLIPWCLPRTGFLGGTHCNVDKKSIIETKNPKQKEEEKNQIEIKVEKFVM